MNEDAEIRKIMDERKPEVAERPDQRNSDEQSIEPGESRFRFSLGLFACALFVLVLSLLFPTEDRIMWAGSGFAILVVAAWQIDKSRRDNSPAKDDQ